MAFHGKLMDRITQQTKSIGAQKGHKYHLADRLVLRKVGKFDRHGLDGFRVIQLVSEGGGGTTA